MLDTPIIIPERFQPAYHYIKQLEQYERCHLECVSRGTVKNGLRLDASCWGNSLAETRSLFRESKSNVLLRCFLQSKYQCRHHYGRLRDFHLL
jgi:hypothetical protein